MPCNCSIGGGQRVHAAGVAADLLPAGQERGQHPRRHRLDLAAQRGQRPAAQHPQHLGVAPLGAGAARGELAGGDPAGGAEPLERLLDDEDAEPEPGRAGRRGERAVGAGVPGDQVAERVGDRFQVRLGQADRQRHAERVAVAAGVLDADPALLAGDPDADRPPRRLQRGQPRPGRRRARPARPSDRSPSRRSSSAASSASRGRRWSVSHCSCVSVSATTAGSSSSRRSTRPSSSPSSVESRASAAARRSASGASPS